jgi:hypothetical protein
MSSNFNPTETEQKILNAVRQLLGSNLTGYLLSGLGETNTVHCRAFTAQSTSSQAEKVTYQFEMKNESGRDGLPAGQDPLVLAALIELLWERQPLDSRITFRDSDILEKLQWPLTSESRTLIKQALERYFLTAYFLIDPTSNENELVNGKYASSKRLLTGYETTSVLLPVKRTTHQRLTRVQFLPEFRYDTLSERKHFLGIDFQGLREMREIPFESSES